MIVKGCRLWSAIPNHRRRSGARRCPTPVAAPDEALIAVAAASFNFLDLAYADTVQAVEALRARTVAGKAVVEIGAQ